MEMLRISRNNSISPNTTPSNRDFITHVYPFKTLPLLKSHLHPKYAIVNAGRKMQTLETVAHIQALVAEYPSLSQINHLYSAWLRRPPPHSKNDPTYNPPDDGGDDDDGDDDDDDRDDPNDGDYEDNQTSRGRPSLNKRRAHPTSPTPNKRRRTNGPSGRKLSEAALVKHNHINWSETSQREVRLRALRQRA
jgi:hypothetical protein